MSHPKTLGIDTRTPRLVCLFHMHVYRSTRIRVEYGYVCMYTSVLTCHSPIGIHTYTSTSTSTSTYAYAYAYAYACTRVMFSKRTVEAYTHRNTNTCYILQVKSCIILNWRGNLPTIWCRIWLKEMAL
jgi:hypothetical protein